MSESTFRALLIGIGISQLALFGWMVISPGSFFDAVGGFGQENYHYIRDAAMFPFALGICLIVSAQRPSWRVPVLAVTAVWFGAHAINHLIDIDESDPGWVGPADFAALALSAVFFAYLGFHAARRDIDAVDARGAAGPAAGEPAQSGADERDR